MEIAIRSIEGLKQEVEAVLRVEDLKRAFGSFPTGVCIVTGRGANGDVIGMTVSSFSPVSLDPPLVLWSIQKKSFSRTQFLQSEYFVINVLGESLSHLAWRFARPSSDKFDGVCWSSGLGGAPVIDDAVTSMECALENVIPASDHDILIGRVMRLQVSEGTPLVYFGGRMKAA